MTVAAFCDRAIATRPARRALPETPRQIRLGMPHLDAGGLSENWLFRHAGDLHWEAIARRLDADTDELRGPDGDRLYPTVVAARARYQVPLSSVRENQVLSWTARVAPCGRSCAHGQLEAELSPGGAGLSLELLTTFAAREPSGGLRTALPSARLAARWTTTSSHPLQAQDRTQAQTRTQDQDDLEIARLARAARRGEALRDDDFSGPAPLVDLRRPVLGCVTHEPSPYADYNGAGLLYFASYVTIADTAERAIVRSRGLSPPTLTTDWALGTSAIRRDVFYYANLALGDSLIAELLDLELVRDDDGGGQDRPAVKTRMRLRHARTGHTIADLVTLRLLVSRERERERAAGRRP